MGAFNETSNTFMGIPMKTHKPRAFAVVFFVVKIRDAFLMHSFPDFPDIRTLESSVKENLPAFSKGCSLNPEGWKSCRPLKKSSPGIVDEVNPY